MELEHFLPSRETSFLTGYNVEQQSLTWTIANFPVTRMSKTMIDSQRIEFTAGEATGHPSTWAVCLEEKVWEDDKRWIGIYLQLETPKATHAVFNNVHCRTRFIIRNGEGEIIKDHGNQAKPTHIAIVFAENSHWGCRKFIDADDVNFCPEESLQIQITFQLYTPPTPNSLEGILEQYQVTFLDNLRKDLAGLLSTPVPCSDIKVISSDKKEFTMQRGILAVRSDVFAAMLSSDMTEANSGVIQLPDMSSNALEVLHNFLYTGKLLTEWSDPGVILELTNAAAKYQLRDLLQFLDLALGKICKSESAIPLLILARQLSLKVAEEELMMFVRKEWMGSADSFMKLLDMLTDDDDEEDEPEKKKQKLN